MSLFTLSSKDGVKRLLAFVTRSSTFVKKAGFKSLLALVRSVEISFAFSGVKIWSARSIRFSTLSMNEDCKSLFAFGTNVRMSVSTGGASAVDRYLNVFSISLRRAGSRSPPIPLERSPSESAIEPRSPPPPPLPPRRDRRLSTDEERPGLALDVPLEPELSVPDEPDGSLLGAA